MTEISGNGPRSARANDPPTRPVPITATRRKGILFSIAQAAGIAGPLVGGARLRRGAAKGLFQSILTMATGPFAWVARKPAICDVAEYQTCEPRSAFSLRRNARPENRDTIDASTFHHLPRDCSAAYLAPRAAVASGFSHDICFRNSSPTLSIG